VLLHGGFPLFFVRTVRVVHSVQEETSDFEIVEGQRITADESLVLETKVLIE
jgi:hypothetical protein